MIDVSNIQLLDDWVLVKKLKDFESERMVGHIIIPDSTITTVRESKVGLVVAKGKGKYNKSRTFRENSIKVGTTVYCTRYEKTKFEAEAFGATDDYMIMREKDIQAYIVFGSCRTIIPLFDKLWVEELPEVEDDKSVIIKIEDDELKDRYWYVRAVGTGHRSTEYTNTPLVVKAGDIVCASKDTGVQVSWVIDNELKKFRIISERDVLFIKESSN